jgi:hypothetical protein
VLVKLDNPKGAHYAGGEIAAPVTQIVLRAALAARDAALDRDGLAASEKSTVAEATDSRDAKSAAGARFARAGGDATDPVARESYDPSDNLAAARTSEEGTASYVVDLPASPRAAAPPRIAVTPRLVPNVSGLSVRQAVRVLHSAGFRVRLVTATSSGTTPAAGTLAAPGSLVQLTRPLE